MIRKDSLKNKEVGKNACLAGPTGLPPLQSAATHGNIGVPLQCSQMVTLQRYMCMNTYRDDVISVQGCFLLTPGIQKKQQLCSSSRGYTSS